MSLLDKVLGGLGAAHLPFRADGELDGSARDSDVAGLSYGLPPTLEQALSAATLLESHDGNELYYLRSGNQAPVFLTRAPGEDNAALWEYLVFPELVSQINLIQSLPIGVMRLTPALEAEFVSRHACHLLGRSQQELLGRGWMDSLSSDVLRDISGLRQRAESDQDIISHTFDHRDAAGRAVTLQMTLIPSQELNNLPTGFYLVFYDVTQHEEANRRLRYVASHDNLTNLLNRETFYERLNQMSDEALRSGVLLFVDADGFKQVNDRFGHDVGDRLLQIMARRLTNVTRAGDLCARIGGDEFVVFAPGSGGDEVMLGVARKIAGVMSDNVNIRGNDVRLSASIGGAWGMAVDPRREMDRATLVDALVNAADSAMYRAKASHSREFCFYDDEVKRLHEQRRDRQSEYEAIYREDRLAMDYQPIVTGGRVVAVEALLRPRGMHCNRNLAEFFECARRSRHHAALFDRITRLAIEDFASWGRALPLDLHLNLDLVQFADETLVARFLGWVGEAGLDCSRICLELTESMVAEDNSDLAGAVRQLAEAGCRIAIDDFGSGFSSFRRLLELDFDLIKIDRYFPSGLAERKLRNTLEGIVRLGESLGVDVLVEGLETVDQLAQVRELGVTRYQGYLFAPAMTPAELLQRFPDWHLGEVG